MRRSILRNPLVYAVALLLAAPSPIAAEPTSKLLGIVDFPTSGSAEAQPHFIEGLLLLHNFEYRDSKDAFTRAQKIDPDFAMAYWGEAMTYNHPLWAQQSRDSAREALRRLGRTPEDRRAKAGTQREKDYLEAVEILYGNIGEARQMTKEQRDDVYRDAMRRVSESYPDDHDAAAFHGLSILGTAHQGRDFATYMQAAAVLHGVWDANRDHPGAAHYLIHSYDDPIHAPLGLPMARKYSKIAPGAAHAQHMVSHIFVALGIWDDMVTANEIAIEVENAGADPEEGRPMVVGHYPHWLEYGLLEQGRFRDAEELMEAAYKRMNDNPKSGERSYFGAMLSRYVVDTEDWSAATVWATDYEANTSGARDYFFTQAYAAAQQGNVDSARKHLARLRECQAELKRPSQTGIMETLAQEIVGLIALKKGEKDEAVNFLREAAEMESNLPMNFGPPPVSKPTHELLGEVLLGLGKHQEAVDAFKIQLARTPRRTASLLGLARAAQATGDAATAAESYRTLAGIWHSADRDRPAYAEMHQAVNKSSD